MERPRMARETAALSTPHCPSACTFHSLGPGLCCVPSPLSHEGLDSRGHSPSCPPSAPPLPAPACSPGPPTLYFSAPLLPSRRTRDPGLSKPQPVPPRTDVSAPASTRTAPLPAFQAPVPKHTGLVISAASCSALPEAAPSPRPPTGSLASSLTPALHPRLPPPPHLAQALRSHTQTPDFTPLPQDLPERPLPLECAHACVVAHRARRLHPCDSLASFPIAPGLVVSSLAPAAFYPRALPGCCRHPCLCALCSQPLLLTRGSCSGSAYERSPPSPVTSPRSHGHSSASTRAPISFSFSLQDSQPPPRGGCSEGRDGWTQEAGGQLPAGAGRDTRAPSGGHRLSQHSRPSGLRDRLPANTPCQTPSVLPTAYRPARTFEGLPKV